MTTKWNPWISKKEWSRRMAEQERLEREFDDDEMEAMSRNIDPEEEPPPSWEP